MDVSHTELLIRAGIHKDFPSKTANFGSVLMSITAINRDFIVSEFNFNQ